MIGNLIKALVKGKKITDKNPWGGETLEWQIDTPPIHENFYEIPTVHEAPYEYKQNETDTHKTQEVK
jgi:cytochrome c oxidase subunit 1